MLSQFKNTSTKADFGKNKTYNYSHSYNLEYMISPIDYYKEKYPKVRRRGLHSSRDFRKLYFQ